MKDAKPFYELKKISTDEIKSGMNVRLTDETLIEVCFEIDGVFKSVKFIKNLNRRPQPCRCEMNVAM